MADTIENGIKRQDQAVIELILQDNQIKTITNDDDKKCQMLLCKVESWNKMADTIASQIIEAPIIETKTDRQHLIISEVTMSDVTTKRGKWTWIIKLEVDLSAHQDKFQ